MEAFLNVFSEPILQALPQLPDAALTLTVGIVVLYIFQWIFERVLYLVRTPRTLFDILISVSRVIMWAILIGAVFQSLGLTQIALAFSGSIAILGVAVGAGANALVQDIIAGLFLSRDRDFNVGYKIKTGDIEGIIYRIDVRKVRVMDSKGCIHVLPTSAFDKSSWVVLDREPEAQPAKSKKK